MALSRLDGEGLMASARSSRAQPANYSASAKLMHWFVAAAVVALLVIGPAMKRLVPEGVYNFHGALGALCPDSHLRKPRQAHSLRRAGPG